MRSLWLILPIALLSAAQMRADSVILVTGEKITGTIKSETPSEIAIDVPVSATITDERILRKEDIAKIIREQPDEKAYDQLIVIQPNPGLSYSSQTYAQILASLDAFQTTYPTSSYLPEIKNLADTFQDEKRRVDAGQLKYMGQWLSKEEAGRLRIQIVALQIYGIMQQQAAAGDLVGAMQTFAALERDYSTTRSYVTAVSLAQQVLARLQEDLATRMEAVKADQDQMQKTIAFTAEPEKTKLIAAAKDEQDRASAAVAAAVESGAKWVPLIPRSQVSIDTLQKTAVSEAQRLAAVPVESMAESVGKVDAARNAISSGDFKTADGLLKDATQLWAQNEAAHYWSDRLKEKMATPTPTPTPAATPKPLPFVVVTPTPKVVAPIAMAPPPAPVPDAPFYMTLSGAMPLVAGVLIAVGLVGSFIQKKRKKAAE